MRLSRTPFRALADAAGVLVASAAVVAAGVAVGLAAAPPPPLPQPIARPAAARIRTRARALIGAGECQNEGPRPFSWRPGGAARNSRVARRRPLRPGDPC